MATYADLQADIIAEAVRPNLTAQVPRFIRQATQRINREVRVAEMERRARAFGNGTRYLACPSGFLEMRRMWNVDDGTTHSATNRRNAMTQVAPQALRHDKPAGRVPYFFCVHRSDPPEVEFDRPLASDREAEMIYVRKYDEFAADTDTNWLLDNHYDLYLEGALFYLYKHDRNNEEAAARAATYKEALAELNRAEGRKDYMQPVFATAGHNVV